MGQIKYRRVFILAGSGALILAYLILWMRMINDPAQRTGADFIAFYAAGRVAGQEGFSQVYDSRFLQSVQEQVVGFPLAEGQVLLYNNVPYLVPLTALFAGDDYVNSFLAWSSAMLFFFLVAITFPVLIFHAHGWLLSTSIESWIGFLVFFPVFVSLTNGQVTALTTLGLSLWFYGLLTRKEWLAGIGLALVTIRPQVALVLAFPFIFKQRRVFLWFFLGSVILLLASWLAVGWNGILDFINQVILSAGGDFYGMQQSAMVNLMGLLFRLFPDLSVQVIHWICWSAYIVAMVALGVIWFMSKTLDERHFGLAVCLALFFSPHLHYHDLALLFIPISCLMLYLSRKSLLPSQTCALFPLVFSFFLVFGSFVPGLKNNFPLLVMIFLAVSPWVWKKINLSQIHRSVSNE